MKVRHRIVITGNQCLKTLVLTLVFLLILSSLAFGEVRLKDVVVIKDQREIQLSGLGLVTGLDGTGDTKTTQFTIRMIGNMMRNFGAMNFNSQKGIMIKGSDYLEDITKEDLSQFDAIILYDYFYRTEHDFKERPEEPWEALDEFVKNGGKLFIDTGARGKEGDSNDLPAVFPISASRKGSLGMGRAPHR